MGEYDGYNLWEAPDNVAMAPVGMARRGGGALSKCETTALLTVEETLDALGRVETIRYRPPANQRDDPLLVMLRKGAAFPGDVPSG